MSYPYPAPYPPPPYQRAPSTSTTGPKALTFIGVAVLVLAIGIGVGGGFAVASGLRAVDKNLQEIDSKVDAAAIATILPGQTETVTLAPSTSYRLWLGPDGSTSTATLPVVTDPTGASLTVSTASWGTSEPFEGWRFNSRQAGLYTITAAADGPALRLMPGVELDTLIDGATGVIRAVGGGFMVATGLGIGLVGLGLVVGGVVWWSVRAKAARQTQAGQPAV